MVPGDIYEEWGGNKDIICILDTWALCMGHVFTHHSCICAWAGPSSYVAKCLVSWQALLLYDCTWFIYTWRCSASSLLALLVQFSGGQRFLELCDVIKQRSWVFPLFSLRPVTEVVQDRACWWCFLPIAPRVTHVKQQDDYVVHQLHSAEDSSLKCCTNTGIGWAHGTVWMVCKHLHLYNTWMPFLMHSWVASFFMWIQGTDVSIDVELYPANQDLSEYHTGFPDRFVLPTLMPVQSHLHCYWIPYTCQQYCGCIPHYLEGKMMCELLLV